MLMETSDCPMERITLRGAWKSALRKHGGLCVALTPGTSEMLKWSAVSLVSMPLELWLLIVPRLGKELSPSTLMLLPVLVERRGSSPRHCEV